MKKSQRNHKAGAVHSNAKARVRRADLQTEYRSLVEAQADLELSRERYADLFDFAPIGYITLSHSGVIEDINLAGCRLLKTSREHAVGRPLLVYIGKSDRRGYLKHLAQCRNRNAEARVELGLARKEGEPPVFVELVSLPLAGERVGRPQFKTALLDVTARRRAEEALQQVNGELEQRVAERTEELTRANGELLTSEKNLADFFEQSPLGLLWVGRDGQIQRANRAQLELMDLTRDKCLGRPITEFVTDPDTVANALQRLARSEVLQNFRASLRRPDGSFRHVLIDANGFFEAGRLAHSRWFVRDTTQRLELEREILAISEQEQQRIGQDLHDGVCQQLTGIKFRTRLLEQKLAKRGVREKRDARNIETMLNQAIEQARGQARGLNPVRIEADGFTIALRELAASVTNIFRVRCACYLPRVHPVPEQTVAIHLYRIAQESITNAIKHGRAKKVDILLTERHGSLRLTIQDNGTGMPLAPRQKTGMGMHIMNYRARSIGAVLDVHRGSLGGTMVTCSLPWSRLRPEKKSK